MWFKLKVLGHLVRRMASGPMDLKPARRLFYMWAGVTLLCALNLSIGIIAGVRWPVALSAVTLVFDLVMLRWAGIRLADAKRRQEKADWERTMFEEWSR